MTDQIIRYGYRIGTALMLTALVIGFLAGVTASVAYGVPGMLWLSTWLALPGYLALTFGMSGLVIWFAAWAVDDNW